MVLGLGSRKLSLDELLCSLRRLHSATLPVGSLGRGQAMASASPSRESLLELPEGWAGAQRQRFPNLFPESDFPDLMFLSDLNFPFT